MATKFLYGAAVQGIQSFIFQTNKLKEIVGASELVDEICSSLFQKSLKDLCQINTNLDHSDENCILHAAGNIKYIFENKDKLKSLYRSFPKIVQEHAPGVTVSQAVVEFNEGEDFSRIVQLLENKLRVQRNVPMRSTTIGMMGIKRSQQTGLPAVSFKVEDGREMFFDEASEKKCARQGAVVYNLCKDAFGMSYEELKDRVPFNIEQIVDKNDWIAVIHADGNGLGQVVQKVGTNRNDFRLFSNLLDIATKSAARRAYDKVKSKSGIIPIRPIVLGGDDLTVVCRADLALDYVETFIKEFENETKEKMNVGNRSLLDGVFTKGKVKDRLTACAGIAFVKSKYPFYYAYDLAESLCSEAKRVAKDKQSVKEGDELPSSCLMFYKVQDSFTEEYSDLIERELKPQQNISLKFGPYFIEESEDHKNHWTVDKLRSMVKLISDEESGSLRSSLREWLTLIHNDCGLATQKLDRIKDNLKPYRKIIEEVTVDAADKTHELVSPLYDILALNTVTNQIIEKE